MAVVCVSAVKVIDIANKKVSVSAVITNDDEPPITVTMAKVDISTGPKKAEAANNLWSKFIVKRNAYLAAQAIAQEITDLQAALDTNIEGRTV